jgi:type III secretion protein V
VPLQRIADLLRRLLEEGISLRNLRGILEAVVENGAQQDVALLAEAVRAALKRQICHGHADANRIIAAYMLDADAEAAIRGALRQTPAGLILALPEGTITALIERIRSLWTASRAPMPVLLTAADIRRHIRGLLVNNGIDAAVLSFNDLLPEFIVQPLGTVRVMTDDARQPGGGAAPMRAAAEKTE